MIKKEKIDLIKLKSEIEEIYGFGCSLLCSSHLRVDDGDRRLDIYSRRKYHILQTNERGIFKDPFILIEEYFLGVY